MVFPSEPFYSLCPHYLIIPPGCWPVDELRTLGGGSEQVALQEGGAIALPWPHEATVQYLKS